MIGQKQQDTFKRYEDIIKRYGGHDPRDPI